MQLTSGQGLDQSTIYITVLVLMGFAAVMSRRMSQVDVTPHVV